MPLELLRLTAYRTDGGNVQGLLRLSRAIDAATGWIGRAAAWLIVISAVVSATNAVLRKAFDISSNAWLEAQWWLFSLAFLLAAPWALAQNDHIRIDILNTRFPNWARHAVELIGTTLFLMPIALVFVVTSWPYFVSAYKVGEQSSNYGGLPVYPLKLLIPVAFTLLFVQAISELIKRIAIIRGELPEFLPTGHPRANQAEERRVHHDHPGSDTTGGGSQS